MVGERPRQAVGVSLAPPGLASLGEGLSPRCPNRRASGRSPPGTPGATWRAARDVSPRAAASRDGRPAQSRFHGARAGRGGSTSTSAFRGTKRPGALRHPSRGRRHPGEPGRNLPIDCNRPSDRRSPGMDPGPQGAFEGSMINVSCNSHYFSQLAAFFIDARAE